MLVIKSIIEIVVPMRPRHAPIIARTVVILRDDPEVASALGLTISERDT